MAPLNADEIQQISWNPCQMSQGPMVLFFSFKWNLFTVSDLDLFETSVLMRVLLLWMSQYILQYNVISLNKPLESYLQCTYHDLIYEAAVCAPVNSRGWLGLIVPVRLKMLSLVSCDKFFDRERIEICFNLANSVPEFGHFYPILHLR